MSYIDDVVKYMAGQKATAFVIPAGKSMLLQVGDQSIPQQQSVSQDQLLTILRQVTPPAMQPMIGQQDFEFPYRSGDIPCQLRVRQNDGTTELIIAPSNGAVGSAATGATGAVATATAANAATAMATKVSTGNSLADSLINVPADRVGTKTVECLNDLFNLLFEINGSDLHVASNEHPMMRLHGTMYKLREFEIFKKEELKKLIWEVTPDRNKEEWEQTHDTDFAYELQEKARFRCNVYADRHGISGAFRLIPSKVLTVEDLNLPKAMVDLCYLSKGLVIVTGPTGSGKSTTLAALVDYVNKVRTDHIITIEDPIEFVHENKGCLVNQREVHVHTDSFKKALRAALREDPDIVLVGEMRDLETVAIAIETAETGHLVFGTLHTSSAASTVDRVIDQFPADQQEQIRVMLSESLKAIIAQILLRKKSGGRIAAWEILLCPPAVANLIREKKTFQLTSMIQVSKGMGMITMNDAVMQLIKDDIVDPMEAYMKVIDKSGLAIALQKEGIPFTPPTDAELKS